MPDSTGAVIRIIGVARKEVAEVVRQPRLIVTLLFGPFLVLLLFGVALRETSPPLRVAIVGAPGNRLADELEDHARTAAPRAVELTRLAKRETAVAELRAGTVTVAVIVPDEAIAIVRANRHVQFVVLHNLVDPIETGSLELFAQGTIDGLNQRILQTGVRLAQEEVARIRSEGPSGPELAAGVERALERGEDVSTSIEPVAAYLDRIGGLAALGASDDGERPVGSSAGAPLQLARAQLNAVSSAVESGDTARASANARALTDSMRILESELSTFERLDPAVVVTPFGVQVNGVVGRDLRIVDYYIPGVVALIIQHLGVTLASLSAIRERETGMAELLLVAPISRAQVLAGKCIAFMGVTMAVAVVLLGLVRIALDAPIVGRLLLLAIGVVALAVASLGLGFAVAAFARTTTEAVHISMLLLLGSIFFSGFFISLQRLTQEISVLAWALPVTSGIRLLQDVMLRGAPVDWVVIAWLNAMALGFSVIGWRRRIGGP